MAAAWLWARSDWRRRWTSLALLAALVAVAGGVAIGAVAGARRADTAFARFVDQTGDPELTASSIDNPESWSPGQLERDGPAFAQAVALPGVTHGERFAAFAVAAGDSPSFFSLALVEEGGQPDRPFLVAGRVFDVDNPTEVMVNEAAAQLHGVDAGDQLELRSVGWGRVGEYLERAGEFIEPDGPELTVTVTGVNRDAFDIAQQDDPFVLLSPAFARQYSDQIVNCPCISLFDVEAGRDDEVLSSLEPIYGPLGNQVGREEDGRLPEQIAKGIDVEVNALLLLAAAAGVAGLIVVAQAMARQTADGAAERQTGTALGASVGQLTTAAALSMAPAVVAGALGAMAVAVALSPLAPRGLAQRAEVDPGVWIDPLTIGIGFAAVVALCAVPLVVVARRAAHRPRAEVPHLAALPAGLGAAGLLGVAFAVRPGRRGRAATSAALVATAIGVAGVLAVWTFEAGRDRLFTDGRLFGVDADLLWQGPVEEVDKAVAAAGETPGIEAVGVRQRLDVELHLAAPGGTTSGFAGAVDARVGWAGPTIVEGRAARRPGEVALGGQLLDELGVALGEPVDVASPVGRTTLTVVGEVVAWETDEIDRGVEMAPDGLAALAGTVCGPECAPGMDVVLARSTDGDVGTSARAALAPLRFAPIPLPSELDNLEQAGGLPWVLAAFLALLGLGGLLHALVTVVRRRRRDVVIARALGLSTAGARATTRWSAMTMVAIGIVVGIPLGVAVGRLAWAATARQLGALVEQAPPWWAAVVVAAGAVAVTLALTELLARRAAAARLSETLRAE